jgi:hypothetical protein
MTHKPSPKHIQKELDRLENSGEEFVLVDVAHKLSSTTCALAFAVRIRGNAKCLTPRNGRTTAKSHSVYKFIKKED